MEKTLSNGKKQEKIEIVKRRINDCTKYTTDKAYYYGNISDKVFYKAKTSYANMLSKSEVLGLIDTSITGNSKVGMILTEEGIYYKDSWENPGYISYNDIAANEKILDAKLGDKYNLKSLKNMIKEINAVDCLSADELLDVMQQGLENLDDLYEKGKGIWEEIRNMMNKLGNDETDSFR